MDKTWSCDIHIDALYDGTFIIKFDGTNYDLLFRESVGNKFRLHNSNNLEEIWSFLLTIKNIPSPNGSYALDVSKLEIPMDLDQWVTN
jgi:hypothetical protein